MDTMVLQAFRKFLQDVEASEMYITGVAGTGKTTSLADIIKYCIHEHIPTATCAYTHRASQVLRDKLPLEGALHNISTLHSFLKKRPTINMQARHVTEVEGNTATTRVKKDSSNGEEPPVVLFVDEFSMVGERDYRDIADLQYNEDGDVILKVVYIGDPNQLPPVKDQQVVYPRGKHKVMLTQIHRQNNGNPLIDTLITLNDYINGAEPLPLEPHSRFIRDADIVKEYKDCKKSKIILSYTNEAVERLNAQIQGYTEPKLNDYVFSPTTKKTYLLDGIYPFVDSVRTLRGDKVTTSDKFHTLDTLRSIEGIAFYSLLDLEGNTDSYAVVFGHSRFLTLQQKLAAAAVEANKKITSTYDENPKEWSERNWQHPLARERADAWRTFMAFKNCVICVDFIHAMTVHKSQGCTYEDVFIDIQDLHKCAKKDFNMYLRLLYVAISRASNKVITN